MIVDFAKTNDGSTVLILPESFVSQMNLYTKCPKDKQRKYWLNNNSFKLNIPTRFEKDVFLFISNLAANKTEEEFLELLSTFTTSQEAHSFCEKMGLTGDVEWFSALTLNSLTRYISSPEILYHTIEENISSI